MDVTISILDWVGRVTAVIFLGTVIWGVYVYFKGILPALNRLGNGLSKRKIAIFAKNDNLTSLKDLLGDSKLFNKNNMIAVSFNGDLGKAEQATLFLVCWPDWQAEMKDILNKMKDTTALIVYAPQEQGKIPPDVLEDINKKRNATIVNFRGRLLNDVMVSMMTTGYQ